MGKDKGLSGRTKSCKTFFELWNSKLVPWKRQFPSGHLEA